MFEKTITCVTMIAYAAWVLGFALVLVDLLGDWETGELGLLFAGMGGVLNVRGFFARQMRREQNAFDIGRDYEQGMSGVRRVR